MSGGIVAGVFAVLLAVVSWLLTNGSRQNRLLSRLERQVPILKDLPPDHEATHDLDASIRSDVKRLASGSGSGETPAHIGPPPSIYRWGVATITFVSAVLAAISVVSALVGTETTIYIAA